MPRSQRIRIFWDLVTCPIPTSYTSLEEVMRDIRLFTSKFGVVTSIKAYWDRNKTQLADDPLRATMPSMGVNLVDCSIIKGYTNDALAKMLSVDLAISAVDDPMNQETRKDNIIIMVISGDKSILYPISLLMLRNYTVFLVVANDETEPFQVTKVFSWYKDILARRSRHPRVFVPVTGPSKPPGWVVNGNYIPQLDLDDPSNTRPPTDNRKSLRRSQQSSVSAKAKGAPRRAALVERRGSARVKYQVQGGNPESSGNTQTQTQEVETQALRDLPLSVFDPLVAVLEETGSMAWRRLATRLAKHKGLYQSAGVLEFGEFIALAVQKRLVSLRGIGDQRRVKLRKR